MSRYTGPRRRQIRKFDNLPGLTTKRVAISRPQKGSVPVKTPGQHGRPAYFFLNSRSDYTKRLIAKQQLRYNYHLNERQLVRYVKMAKKASQSTGRFLLNLLEMRLDNVVYRLGMAKTILAARQLVTHGHILVNQKKVNIPSYGCCRNDTISVRNKLQSRKIIRQCLREKHEDWRPPNHLKFSRKNLVGVIEKTAPRSSVEIKINSLKVIEFYSKN